MLRINSLCSQQYIAENDPSYSCHFFPKAPRLIKENLQLHYNFTALIQGSCTSINTQHANIALIMKMMNMLTLQEDKKIDVDH